MTSVLHSHAGQRVLPENCLQLSAFGMRRTVAMGLVIALLGGCAELGVATSDPNGKIKQAYSLMSEDRLLLAEDLLHQSLITFQQSDDKPGMAETYHAFGNFYKNELYVNGRRIGSP